MFIFSKIIELMRVNVAAGCLLEVVDQSRGSWNNTPGILPFGLSSENRIKAIRNVVKKALPIIKELHNKNNISPPDGFILAAHAAFMMCQARYDCGLLDGKDILVSNIMIKKIKELNNYPHSYKERIAIDLLVEMYSFELSFSDLIC